MRCGAILVAAAGMFVVCHACAGTLKVSWELPGDYPVEVNTTTTNGTQLINVTGTNGVVLDVPNEGWVEVRARSYVDEIVRYEGTNDVAVVERRYGPTAGPLIKYLDDPKKPRKIKIVE